MHYVYSDTEPIQKCEMISSGDKAVVRLQLPFQWPLNLSYQKHVSKNALHEDKDDQASLYSESHYHTISL